MEAFAVEANPPMRVDVSALNPLISVVMPAYNSEKYIEEAIQSVLNQTITDFELVIVDDCSTDSTYEIAKSFQERDSRVRLFRNKDNFGVAYSRNCGIEACRGRYVALLDSDDYWYPEKLERQLEVAKKENADIIYCSYAMVNEKNATICEDYIVPPQTSLNGLLNENVISCSTAFLQIDAVRKHRFLTDYYLEDYVFWLQIMKNGHKAIGISDVLSAYRIRENSRASNKIKVAIYRWRVYRDFMKLPLWKSAYHFVRYALAGVKKYRRV